MTTDSTKNSKKTKTSLFDLFIYSKKKDFERDERNHF